MLSMFSFANPPLWDSNVLAIATAAVVGYLLLVRALRYRRKAAIEAPFTSGGRQLSSMTVQEAQDIVNQLQELEFPRAMAKARQIALLKVRTAAGTSRDDS